MFATQGMFLEGFVGWGDYGGGSSYSASQVMYYGYKENQAGNGACGAVRGQTGLLKRCSFESLQHTSRYQKC